MHYKYNILTLDGGGSWALLEAMALQRKYGDTPCLDILRQFDLVVTNSGGSLVLAAMLSKNTMVDVRNCFENEATRKSIFSRLKLYEKTCVEIIASAADIGPKYDTVQKLAGIRSAMGPTSDIPIKNIPEELKLNTKFIIMGYDYDRNRAEFFRSHPSASSAMGAKAAGAVTLAEAVHASSNAPVMYFNKPADFNYPLDPEKPVIHQFWDGAVGGNNNRV